MIRREFLTGAGAAIASMAASGRKPNIVWITCEDISPHLGCYGDPDAATPNLDKLASQGVKYTGAYATAPVCSPSRSCLITGVVANSMGTMHLRGLMPRPSSVPCFPELLRDAGYYTSNNVKEDYNFTGSSTWWDESSNQAHWRKRRKGQPFFSVFNFMGTHQGQIRYSRAEFQRISATLPPELRHDPNRIHVPPYFPDTPDVRLQLAILHTQISRMDAQAGQVLRELEEDGLANETIVLFYSDHGTGLPRGKRFLHRTGLRVPLIVRFPESLRTATGMQAGKTDSRLVSFVDFPPTVLSLTGISPSKSMQGHAFLGEGAASPRRFVFAARDRVDEEIEMSRTVFDGRWQYIRNWMPHRPVLQHGSYSEVAPVWRELRRLHSAGKLAGDQALLMRDTKPVEELYDLRSDTWQLRNLAEDPAHRERIATLRKTLFDWQVRIRDTGLLPEADMHSRAGKGSPYDLGDDRFPVRRILEASVDSDSRRHLKDRDSAVRYWAATALFRDGKTEDLQPLLEDSSPSVRIVAAEALVRQGQNSGLKVLAEQLRAPDGTVRLAAAAAAWHLGEKARPLSEAIRFAADNRAGPDYQSEYCQWAAKKTSERLGTGRPEKGHNGTIAGMSPRVGS